MSSACVLNLLDYPCLIAGSGCIRANYWVVQALSAMPLVPVLASRPKTLFYFQGPISNLRGNHYWNLGHSPTRSALRRGSSARRASGFHNRRRGSTQDWGSFWPPEFCAWSFCFGLVRGNWWQWQVKRTWNNLNIDVNLLHLGKCNIQNQVLSVYVTKTSSSWCDKLISCYAASGGKK